MLCHCGCLKEVVLSRSTSLHVVGIVSSLPILVCHWRRMSVSDMAMHAERLDILCNVMLHENSMRLTVN